MSVSILELDNTVRAFYEGSGDVVCIISVILVLFFPIRSVKMLISACATLAKTSTTDVD